ncbi:MAG TPA: hypothetical protein VGI39_17220 [Polyangiaceae bacterium]
MASPFTAKIESKNPGKVYSKVLKAGADFLQVDAERVADPEHPPKRYWLVRLNVLVSAPAGMDPGEACGEDDHIASAFDRARSDYDTRRQASPTEPLRYPSLSASEWGQLRDALQGRGFFTP